MPFLAWYGWRRSLHGALLVAGIGALVGIGHYSRNIDASGSPLGPGYVMLPDPVPYANEEFSPSAVLSNTIRGAVLHLGQPDWSALTSIPWIDDTIAGWMPDLDALPDAPEQNEPLARGTRVLLESLDIDPDDPSTTWKSRRFRIAGAGWNFEDTAPNPMHAVIVAAAVLLAPWIRMPRRSLALGYLACLVAGLLLFSAIFKGQVYHTRLHLPLLVLAAAPVGTVLERLGRGGSLVSLALLVSSLPWLVNNQTRPLLGEKKVLTRDALSQTFVLRPQLRPEFEKVAAEISRSECRSIGVRMKNDGWEYPLWRMLGGTRAEIRHVEVTNYSRKLARRAPFRDFAPCAIVDISMAGVGLEWRVGRRALSSFPEPEVATP